MRPHSVVWPLAIAASHDVVTIVDAYLDGQLTAASVPIISGTITYDATARITRRLEIEVPARDQNGRSFDPSGDPTHPLAAYGQRLQVRTGITLPGGVIELMNQGWYLITDWSRTDAGGTVIVQAQGLTRLLQDARLYHPYAPGPTDLREVIPELLDDIVPSVIESTLPERSTSSQKIWQRDRLEALDDLADAWPARWDIDDDGAAHFYPPYAEITPSSVPVRVLQDGVNGTVVDRDRTGSRDRIRNAVVVTGAVAASGAVPSFTAERLTGPMRVSGPFGRVPLFYTSDMITTVQQAIGTANSMLARRALLSRTENVVAVPDPALELGDIVRIYTEGDALLGRAQSITLPLTAAQGAMRCSVATDPELDQSGDT